MIFMSQEIEFPARKEKVITKIKKILDYGAIVELLEYPQLEGFVHISNIASGWIKNIRNFVKEGQIKVAEVLIVNPEKRNVELSFRSISSADEREKLEQFKQFKRAKSLIEIIANKRKEKFETVWAEIAEPLIAEHATIGKAFNKIALEGESAALNVPKKWLPDLLEIIEKNVPVSEKEIRAILTMSSFDSYGIDKIKKVLDEAVSGIKVSKDLKFELSYIGSGRYDVRSKALSFKKAEHAIKQFQDSIVALMKKNSIIGEIKRQE